MRRSFALVLVALLLAGSGLAVVEVGPGARIFQDSLGSNVNFSQDANFSFIGVREDLTDFGNSNFTVEPESSSGAELDFYRPFADRQEYVSNFTARASTRQEVSFNVSDLPSDDFYEAYFSDNGTRIFIGYTGGDEAFNFSYSVSSEDVSLFNYGEKGVEIDNITFNDSEPVEGETLGIEEEIFNEGVVDDEAVNKTLTISTYNGSGWQQKQFRSEDLAVPIENTETKQSFTAQFKGSFTNTTQYRNGGGELGLGYQNGTAGDNLVGYWRMDEAVQGAGGTVEDYSGEGKDGTLNGGLNTQVEGLLSTSAFEFDGADDYILTPQARIKGDEIFVSAWVKPEYSGSDYQRVVSAGTYQPWNLVIYEHSNSEWEPYMDLTTENSRQTSNDPYLSKGSHTFNYGEWHYLAGRYSGSEVSVWVDGEKLYSEPVSGDLDESKYNDAQYTTIGDRNDGTQNERFRGTMDEVRIYNRSLSTSEVKDLYFHGAPFHGNYITEEIQEGELTKWYRVNLDANIPDQTELDAEFRALDSGGNIVDTDSFSVEDGDNYYNVSVQDSEGAELYLNGSSQNFTKSWEVDSLKVISGGPYVDEWEVKPGPWRFNVSLDPNDEVKETDETNNNFSETLDVDSYQLVHGGTDLRLELGVNTDDLYIWNPSKEEGFLYFSDVDSSFSFSDLRPVNGSEFPQVDRNLSMVGHNDSVEELWDDDNDGYADHIRSWNVAGNELDVPVVNSSSAGTFETGILYDTGDGSPYDGSQDLVFVTKLKPATAGKNGVYDYEARIPYGLRSLRPNDDSVRIYQELK